jgi:glycosyltransferase involved in cell wall biosynthesis
MRICHIITRLIVGGAQENTILTCRGLVDKGHDVTLIAGPETGPEGSLWEMARACGCELIELDAMRRTISPGLDWRAMTEMQKLFERISPDIVHTHSSKAGILGRRAAYRAKIPCIIHTIHGMSFNRTQAWSSRTIYRLLEQYAATHTTHFVTVADAMIDQAVEAGIASREKFTTIRSGLETERFAPDRDVRAKWRSRWGVKDDDIVIGTIARLFENKGYEEILRAMPSAVTKCDRLRFVWVGDGAHRSRYERKLNELGLLHRVVFTGLLPPEEVGPIINGFDLLLHASKWEGLPRAMVQALLVEKPVVSFDNDGAPEVVDEQTGVLVPLGDVDGLVSGIVRLAADAALREKLGKTGRQRCLEAFDWHTMVDQLETLYEKLSTT